MTTELELYHLIIVTFFGDRKSITWKGVLWLKTENLEAIFLTINAKF